MIWNKLKSWLKKIQVEQDPGLTTAQLMLTNDDLRPGKSLASCCFVYCNSLCKFWKAPCHFIVTYF